MFEKRFKVGITHTDIEKLDSVRDLIESFYIGLPITGNCRHNYIQLNYLREFLTKTNDIPVWVTVNGPAVLPEDMERTIDMLVSTYQEYKFHGYICADIFVIQKLRSNNIPVQVSTVADIRDLNDISRYYEMGLREIVLSYKVNRNMDFINNAVKHFPDVKFILIANELCESNCPHRMAHFMLTSMNRNLCYQCPIRLPVDSDERRLRLLQNTLIPPENLQYYPESIIFKLPTRMTKFNNEDILKHLKIYSGRLPYKNIYKLVAHHLDITKMNKFKPNKELFKHWLNCKNQCYQCNLCNKEIEERIKDRVKALLA